MPGYTDFVRSQVTNYCYSSGKDLAVRYTWEKADINSAMLDHNYLARPFVEYWIDSAIQVPEKLVKPSPSFAGNRFIPLCVYMSVYLSVRKIA